MDVEVRRRIQAGVNAWRKLVRVMRDRKISRMLKRNVLDYSVVAASTYGLETTSMREQLDKENIQCKETGEKEIERPKKISWN